MQSLIITSVFLVSMVLTLPILAAQDSGGYQPNQSGAAVTGSGANQRANINAPAAIVSGTVIAIDSVARTITIVDAMGTDRAFSDLNKDELMDVKTGDRVNVTLQQGDPSKAKKIEKDKAQSQL